MTLEAFEPRSSVYDTHMHRIFFIQEILLNIFGHFASEERSHVAVLAGTCRTFKEPALDVLWEELPNISPLTRCLPEACCEQGGYFSFSRPLSEAEWNTLRGYTCRVRRLLGFGSLDDYTLDDRAFEVLFTQAPFTVPLFPNLRSLVCRYYSDTILPVAHIAVPPLTSLILSFQPVPGMPLPTEFLAAVGACCPNMRDFSVFHPPAGPLGAAISGPLSRWTNLRHVYCFHVTLSADTILQLPSRPTLEKLSFMLSAEDHIIHRGPTSIFFNLATLEVNSTYLKSITSLFSRIRLPAITYLSVTISKCTPKQGVREFWMTVQRACPSTTLTRLSLSSSDYGIENSIDQNEQERLYLTLDDLLPYKDFGNLCKIFINFPWSVKLTDADLLDVLSTLPRLEELSINRWWGWRVGGNDRGITLSGLVQFLHRCPSLCSMCLAIDAPTFAQIPHGLDVSFPLREGLFLDILDSYIPPELVPGLTSVFTTLGLVAQSSLQFFHNFQ